MFCSAKIYGTGLWNFQYMSRNIRKQKERFQRMKKKFYKKFSYEHFKNFLNKSLASNTEFDYNGLKK